MLLSKGWVRHTTSSTCTCSQSGSSRATGAPSFMFLHVDAMACHVTSDPDHAAPPLYSLLLALLSPHSILLHSSLQAYCSLHHHRTQSDVCTSTPQPPPQPRLGEWLQGHGCLARVRSTTATDSHMAYSQHAKATYPNAPTARPPGRYSLHNTDETTRQYRIQQSVVGGLIPLIT